MKVNLKNIKWIFFDLDDTLIASSDIYENCYRKMRLNSDRFFSLAKSDVKKTLPTNHTSGHNRFLYFKRYLELKNRFSSKALIQLNDTYEKFLLKEIKSFLSKHPRIDQLNKISQFFKLAIVTNETARMQTLKLDALDPQGTIFKFILTSEDAGFEKPSPVIFNKALALARCNAKEVLFIGDSFENDYKPAKKIGMNAVLFQEFSKKPYLGKNTYSINDFNELIQWINDPSGS